jgi:hypothetical protein
MSQTLRFEESTTIGMSTTTMISNYGPPSQPTDRTTERHSQTRQKCSTRHVWYRRDDGTKRGARSVKAIGRNDRKAKAALYSVLDGLRWGDPFIVVVHSPQQSIERQATTARRWANQLLVVPFLPRYERLARAKKAEIGDRRDRDIKTGHTRLLTHLVLNGHRTR